MTTANITNKMTALGCFWFRSGEDNLWKISDGHSLPVFTSHSEILRVYYTFPESLQSCEYSSFVFVSDIPACHRTKRYYMTEAKIVGKCVWLMVWTAPGTSVLVRNIYSRVWMEAKSVSFHLCGKLLMDFFTDSSETWNEPFDILFRWRMCYGSENVNEFRFDHFCLITLVGITLMI